MVHTSVMINKVLKNIAELGVIKTFEVMNIISQFSPI